MMMPETEAKRIIDYNKVFIAELLKSVLGKMEVKQLIISNIKVIS